eukprot:5667269-Prorocentrum_lima.AAC.1
MSRADIAPFAGYTQRHAHQSKNKHLKFINHVLRYCKRVKSGMYFKKLVACTTRISYRSRG